MCSSLFHLSSSNTVICSQPAIPPTSLSYFFPSFAPCLPLSLFPSKHLMDSNMQEEAKFNVNPIKYKIFSVWFHSIIKMHIKIFASKTYLGPGLYKMMQVAAMDGYRCALFCFGVVFTHGFQRRCRPTYQRLLVFSGICLYLSASVRLQLESKVCGRQSSFHNLFTALVPGYQLFFCL